MALTALCVFCAPASTGATRPDDYVARAMQILRSLFPGLTGVSAVIFDERDLDNRPPLYPDAVNPFTMQLYMSDYAVVRDPRGLHRSEPVLSSRFDFDFETHELKFLWISGPFVADRLDKLKKEVEEHPEWPDELVVKVLKGAGAKFGPNDQEEFLRALPLKKLEPFTGLLEVVSAEFVVRLRPVEGEIPEACLRWSVVAKWHSPDGQYEAERFLIFEPFEGALVDFSLRSAPTPARR